MSSSMAIDQSLDTIIANKKKLHRSAKKTTLAKKKVSSISARKNPKANIVGKAKAVSAPAAGATSSATVGQPVANKINISNLPPDVNEVQVRELFATTIGPLKEVNMHFDARGKSKGIASVVFSRKGDANKAATQYNGRLIDGKRAMKVELVVDASATLAKTPQSLADRVAPAVAAPSTPAGSKVASKIKAKVARRKAGLKKKSTPRPQKTAEEMDAEMEDYASGVKAPAT